jgi:Protein of unknown function (DUF2924)
MLAYRLQADQLGDLDNESKRLLDDAASPNGTTYPSLSKVALAITGTRWNGPRFFGLRDNLARTNA